MAAVDTSFREPPASDEAEQALLGAILAENLAYDRVGDFLKPEHFADGIHGEIFAACGSLINEGRVANAITLRNLFENRDELAEVGGGEYLAQLQAGVVTIINARDYGRTIHDLWLRRQLAALGHEVTARAYNAELDDDAVAIAGEAADQIASLVESGQREGGLVGADKLMLEVAERTEAIRLGRVEPAIQTGFTDLDAMIGGLHRQDLIILGGRPSMGKTALATKIAYRVASTAGRQVDEEGNAFEQEQPVAFFSLEMSAEQLNRRIAAERAGVDFEATQTETGLNEDEHRAFIDECMALRRIPLFVDGTPRLAPAQMMARARALKRKRGLSLVIIDHLGHVKPPNRSSSHHIDLGDITKACKEMAKRLDVPVILLCQLSRGLEQREDKRPVLSDLRESGHIEEDADTVLFVHREHYYKSRTPPIQKDNEDDEAFNKRLVRWENACSAVVGLGDVICAKQRSGPVNKVSLAFIGHLMRWENRARDLYGETI